MFPASARYFELGPDASYGGNMFGKDRQPYVKLSNISRNMVGSDVLLTRECASFDELEAEVLAMKVELDAALAQAKGRFSKDI